jgi:hypothetical protein
MAWFSELSEPREKWTWKFQFLSLRVEAVFLMRAFLPVHTREISAKPGKMRVYSHDSVKK